MRKNWCRDRLVFGQIKGFTFIELMVYLTLIGMLFLFTIPNMTDWMHQTQQSNIRETLIQASQLARLKAMTTGQTWVLAPLSDDEDWSLGIGLYSLQAYHAIPRLKPRYQWPWVFPKTQINWRGFQSNRALFFSGDPSQYAVNGRFFVQMSNRHQLQLIVNRLGFIHDQVDGKYDE